jgi:hypothetical protein
LRDLCEDIFIEQLAGWFNDETTWPEDLGFEVFSRWFDFQHHSMLVDLSDEPLILESDLTSDYPLSRAKVGSKTIRSKRAARM